MFLLEYDYDDSADGDYMAGDKREDMPTVTQKPRKIRKGQDEEEEEYYSRPPKVQYDKSSYPCDRLANLFILQQQRFISGDGFMAFSATNSTRFGCNIS